MIQELGTNEFGRIKLGVGRPDGPQDVSGWVLGKMTEQGESVYVDQVFYHKSGSTFHGIPTKKDISSTAQDPVSKRKVYFFDADGNSILPRPIELSFVNATRKL